MTRLQRSAAIALVIAVILTDLNAYGLWLHSAWRAAVVAFVSALLVARLDCRINVDHRNRPTPTRDPAE